MSLYAKELKVGGYYKDNNDHILEVLKKTQTINGFHILWKNHFDKNICFEYYYFNNDYIYGLNECKKPIFEFSILDYI